MKKLLLFDLDDCPYCHYAKRALKELAQEEHIRAALDKVLNS